MKRGGKVARSLSTGQEGQGGKISPWEGGREQKKVGGNSTLQTLTVTKDPRLTALASPRPFAQGVGIGGKGPRNHSGKKRRVTRFIVSKRKVDGGNPGEREEKASIRPWRSVPHSLPQPSDVPSFQI